MPSRDCHPAPSRSLRSLPSRDCHPAPSRSLRSLPSRDCHHLLPLQVSSELASKSSNSPDDTLEVPWPNGKYQNTQRLLMANLCSCDPVDPAWGEYIFLGAQERRAGSLYENQNSLKIPKSEHCVVRIPTPEGNVLVEGGDDLSVRLFIEGGSDFPRIRLRVIAGEKAGLPTKMEGKIGLLLRSACGPLLKLLAAIFLPWSPVGFDFPRSSVALGPQTPSASEFTFSLRLKDLTFQAPFNLRQDVRQRYAHVFGSSEAARITFNYKDPIMLNCNADLSWLSASHRDTMRNFQQLRSCSKVVILTRSSVKLVSNFDPRQLLHANFVSDGILQLFHRATNPNSAPPSQVGHAAVHQRTCGVHFSRTKPRFSPRKYLPPKGAWVARKPPRLCYKLGGVPNATSFDLLG